MKKFIIQAAIVLFKCMLSIIYSFFKLCPVNQDKVLFCSRQSDDIPLDFLLLEKKLKEKNHNIRTVMICNRISHDIRGAISFSFDMLRSMYHLATGGVCIIDAYWPAVSMLNHRKSLKVIQIWHSIGKMKKSGYQALDKQSGRSSAYAKLLNMHGNYDYFVGGAKFWNKFYCEAFNITEERILNYGLPRIDYLIENQQMNRELFLEQYPELKDKKIVLYAPTFRKNMKSSWDQIAEAETFDDIVIVVRNHPGQNASRIEETSRVRYIDGWSTMDMLAVCDVLITDYSSIAFEAAVLKKKTYFWTYDYDAYIQNSGINIDLKSEMSENLYEDLDELMYAIENDKYSVRQQQAYIEKYLIKDQGHSTEMISDFIIGLLETGDIKHEVYNHGRWESSALEPVSRSF